MPSVFPSCLTTGLRAAVAAIAGVMFVTCAFSMAAEMKAGTGRAKITPEKPLWMSGYASRDHAAEGTLHDLWAKVLVVEDGRGERLALVTLDLVGIDRRFSQEVCSRLERENGLA